MGYVYDDDLIQLGLEVALDARVAAADNPKMLELDIGSVNARAMRLRDRLAHADALDTEALRMVAEFAREQANAVAAERAHHHGSSGDGSAEKLRRQLARSAAIIERCDAILLALAETKLPEGAMRVIGREPADPFASTNGKAGAKLTAVDSARSVNVGEVFRDLEALRGQAGMAAPAADTWVEREMSSAEHEERFADEQRWRLVLARIVAVCKGEQTVCVLPFDGHPRDVEAMVSTLRDACEAENERHWTALAQALDLDRADHDPASLVRAVSERPRPVWSVPEDHPLRTHNFGAWIEALMRRETVPAASGCFTPNKDRLDALRQIAERIEMQDVDGLRGIRTRIRDTTILDAAETYILGVVTLGSPAPTGDIAHGQHRVPRLAKAGEP